MKRVKITAEQLAQHRAKNGMTEEQKAKIIEQMEIAKYGREARLKRQRKQDVKTILVEKGTRPKGKYQYSQNPLAKCFKEEIDGITDEGLTEARIEHFS